jgi:hypothetical protein
MAGSIYGDMLGLSQQTYGSTLQGYANALSGAQASAGNIAGGYGSLLSQQQAAQQPIIQGYGQLGQQVQGTIQGVEASQRQAIADSYAQQQGQAQQQLINSAWGTRR